MKNKLFSCVAYVMFGLCALFFAQTGALAADEGYAHPESLMSVEQLREALAKGDALKILDLRDADEFNAGHVPGAVCVAPAAFADPKHPVPNMLPAPRDLARVMGEYGISDKDSLLLYAGQDSPERATRLWWILTLYGKKDVRVLDGNYQAWVAAGGDVQTGEGPAVKKAAYAVPKSKDTAMVVSFEQVLAPAENTLLVDARAPEIYSGKVKVAGAKKLGHIPGAVNVFTLDSLTENGTFKDLDALRELYVKAGVTPDKNIIVYCNRGNWASHTYFTLTQLLGYPHVSLYDGSWMEWNTKPDAPVAAGAAQ